MHSQQQVNRLIEEERERLIAAGKEPRIVLMGFSQGASPFRPFDSFGSIIDELFDNSGGAMALLSTLTSPHANRIEAAVVLATYLPLIDDMEDVRPLCRHGTSHSGADLSRIRSYSLRTLAIRRSSGYMAASIRTSRKYWTPSCV